MGSTHSSIKIGQDFENAIRFGIPTVEFDDDITSKLAEIQPELRKLDHCIFWQTEHTLIPNRTTVTTYTKKEPAVEIKKQRKHRKSGSSTDSPSTSSEPPTEPEKVQITTTVTDTKIKQWKTIVHIRRCDDLKQFPLVDWEGFG